MHALCMSTSNPFVGSALLTQEQQCVRYDLDGNAADAAVAASPLLKRSPGHANCCRREASY